jgi:CspA family cold shock protein
MPRSTGTVKWFSREKGYGFIRQADGPDVFVHYSAIQAKGFRTLEEGEQVEFEIIEEPKGLRAQNVVRLDESPEPSGDDTANTMTAPADATPSLDEELDADADLDADLLDPVEPMESDTPADR